MKTSERTKSGYITQKTAKGFVPIQPEDREIAGWLKTSKYQFAESDLDVEGEWADPKWRCWATPISYIYEDYRAWKFTRISDPSDPDHAALLSRSQFGAALNTIYPDLNGISEDGLRRKLTMKRECTRTGVVKVMAMYRGVRHPDSLFIRERGRPRNGSTTPNSPAPNGPADSDGDVVEAPAPGHGLVLNPPPMFIPRTRARS